MAAAGGAVSGGGAKVTAYRLGQRMLIALLLEIAHAWWDSNVQSNERLTC